jgi:hypothetical protein
MRTLSQAAQAAKAIRAELKKRSISAKVTSKVYSMGSSVDVTITQDLEPKTAAEVKDFCGQYQQGHFDGMTDMYEYSNGNDNLPQAKFVFVRIEYTDERVAAAKELAESYGRTGYEADEHSWRILNGSDQLSDQFWA